MIDVSLYLKELEQYNVKAEPNLVRLCQHYSDDPQRLINALYALKEAHDTNYVNSPIAYIYSAIDEGWIPRTIDYQFAALVNQGMKSNFAYIGA